MKLLFVLGQVYPHDDANSLIMTRLSKELRKRQPDISVFFLGSSIDEKTKYEEKIDDINISRFKINNRYPQSLHLQGLETQSSGRRKLLRQSMSRWLEP